MSEIPLHEPGVKYDPICFQEATESDLSLKKRTSSHYETCSELDQKIKGDPADLSEKKNQAKKGEKGVVKDVLDNRSSESKELTGSEEFEPSVPVLIPSLFEGNNTEISQPSQKLIEIEADSDYCVKSSSLENLTLDSRKQSSHCLPVFLGQNLIFKENKDSPVSKETFSYSDQSLSDKSEVSRFEISVRDKYPANSDSDATVICDSITSEVNTLDESVSGQFDNNSNLSDQRSSKFDAFSGTTNLFHLPCESLPFKSYQYS